MQKYIKLTYRNSPNKNTTIWAIKESENSLLALYMPVDSEGDDLGRIDKKGNVILPKLLLSKDLIVSEKPGYIHKKYGTLRVGIEPPGNYWNY